MSGLFAAFQCLVYLVCLALYDHDDYLPPVSPSKSPKLGIPSSEGIGIDLYSVYLISWPPGEG
jgi:hypothetical protein